MDYYLSMKQILLTQISSLCQQKQKNESDEISNVLESNLNNLQNALEQIKSYDHNTYFKCIIKQFNCELNNSEKKTLRQLTEQDTHNDNNEYEWIFYKGFKKWYQNLYNQNDGGITNTARAETLFLGAQTEFSNHLFQNELTNKNNKSDNNNYNDTKIYNIWQTLIGINMLNKYKSHHITKRDIMGKKSLIDVTKSIHYTSNTYNTIIKSSLMRLSIVQNNLFRTTIQYNQFTAHIIHIYDAEIFKIIASILWTPKLASHIINICIINNKLNINKPSNFPEAFAIQQTKRLSQHGQNKSTAMSLPDIPETPTSNNMDTDDAITDISDHNKIENNSNSNDTNDSKDIENENANDNNLDVSSAENSHSQSHSQSISNDTNHSYAPGTELMENAATRPSFNADDENEFYDHHGQHESTYSNEFSIIAEQVLPGYPTDIVEDNENKNEEEQHSDSDTDTINTEYTDSNQDNKDEKNDHSETDNNIHEDKALDTENEQSSDTYENIQENNNEIENENETDNDNDNDIELEDKDGIVNVRPDRLERMGTMVEYDVENILSGDTVINTTFDAYVANKSKSLTDDENKMNINIEKAPQTNREMKILNGTDGSINIENKETDSTQLLNVLAPPLPPLKLSASSPDVMSNHKENSTMITTTSKAFLHGYYKNATSEIERWKRLKQRINRHWDEDVTTKMRIFCQENEYEFEDVLDDIADTLVSIDSSNIISHLKDELFWNDAKTLRFYRTLRRILISRQSTQFISQFNGNELGIGNLNTGGDNIVKIIDLKGHSGNPNSKSLPLSNLNNNNNNIMEHEPPYLRRTSHELQMEKAWWSIKRSLLQNNWEHSVVIEFKKLCFEDDFHSIALIIDDIGCFDNGDSLLMPALAQRLKWNNKILLKFVNDLRIALTDDMNRLARDSRDVKRVEIPTIEFQRTDSVSISGSPNPNENSTVKDLFNDNKGIELEVPTPVDAHDIYTLIKQNEKERIDKLKKYEAEQTPPILSRTSTPGTVKSDRSLTSLKDRMIDVTDHESLLNLWKNEYLGGGDLLQESMNKCRSNVHDECIVYHRIMFIMEFYMSWIVIDSDIDIYTFIDRLDNYSNIQLWNDYFHIRTYHSLKINPNWNNNTDICIAETCRILTRYHRNRTLCKDNETRLEMYNIKECNQTMDVITQQLCDIIHCLLFHPIALNTNNYKQLTVQNSIDTEFGSNNSDDEVDDMKDNLVIVQQQSIEDDDNKEGELLGIGVKIVDSKIYSKLRGERIKYHKFLSFDSRLAYNHNEAEIIVNKKNSKLKRSVSDGKGKGKGNKSWRTLPGLGTSHNNEWEIFLSLNMKNLEQYSEYNEFHDELLNNDIENISEEQWNDTWKRAELFKQTWKGKQMISKKNRPGLRMRKNDPIPTHYIMALMIWCNFDTLCYSFRKHCIDIQMGQKERFQFSRWGFWLNACIECYGQNIEQCETFYCCVNNELLLNEIWLKFTYPTSITSSYLITQIYSNNKYNKQNGNGIIFVLNKRINDSNCKPYINCQWISDYGYEECEKLIFNGNMDVKSIQGLTDIGYNYYEPYIFTIKWWDIMTNVSKYKYFHNGLGEDKEKILVQLLINIGNIKKEKQNNNIIQIPPYVQQLFANLCNRDFLDINLKLLDDLLLSPILKQRFIDDKDGRIDFWRLIRLFPNATKFTIKLPKGLKLDSFICEKFLFKTIQRWNKIYKIDFKLNCVVLSSNQQNTNLKQQTKHLLKPFQLQNWMIFFTKAGNKMKFEKNTNFAKRTN